MEQFLTIAVAILGSGLLSTIVNVVSNKSRDGRHAELLEAWVNEGKLLKDLEKRAGLSGAESSAHSRNLALLTAAKTYINTAVAHRLVPKNNFEIVGYLLAGILLALIGIIALALGIVGIDFVTEVHLIILCIVLLLIGVVAALLGGLWIFKGLKSETYRGIMRTVVQRTLNADTFAHESSHPYAERFDWVAGKESKFRWTHRIALPADLRQTFKHFMRNAHASEVVTDSTTSLPEESH